MGKIEKISGIYTITCKDTGCIYVGSALKNMSEAQRSRTRSEHEWLPLVVQLKGRKMSPEWREKMSIARKLWWERKRKTESESITTPGGTP